MIKNLTASRIKELLPKIVSEIDLLSSFARDIGYALAKTDDNTLREIRNVLVDIVVPNEFSKGLIIGMVEMIDGHRNNER